MYQEGGAAPDTTGAPTGAPGAPAPAGGNPDEMLKSVIESQDPQLALQFCNTLAQQMGIAPGGDGSAAPAASAQPMGRYGMKVPKIKL